MEWDSNFDPSKDEDKGFVFNDGDPLPFPIQNLLQMAPGGFVLTNPIEPDHSIVYVNTSKLVIVLVFLFSYKPKNIKGSKCVKLKYMTEGLKS